MSGTGGLEEESRRRLATWAAPLGGGGLVAIAGLMGVQGLQAQTAEVAQLASQMVAIKEQVAALRVDNQEYRRLVQTFIDRELSHMEGRLSRLELAVHDRLSQRDVRRPGGGNP